MFNKGPERIWDEAAVRTEIAGSNPYKDQWNTAVELSPEQQAIYNAQTATTLTTSRAAQEAAQRLRGYLGTDLDTSGLVGFAAPPTMETLDGRDYGAERQRVEQALMDRLAAYQQRDQEGLDARLAAQGISLGSQANNAAQDNQARAVNDARLAIIAQAGQEQSRLFGMDVTRMQANNEARLTGAQSQNATRAQQLAELLQLRAQPINEVAALFGLGNGITVPTASSLTPTSTNPAEIGGYMQQSYQQRAAAAAAGNQATAQGVAAVAGAAATIAI